MSTGRPSIWRPFHTLYGIVCLPDMSVVTWFLQQMLKHTTKIEFAVKKKNLGGQSGRTPSRLSFSVKYGMVCLLEWTIVHGYLLACIRRAWPLGEFDCSYCCWSGCWADGSTETQLCSRGGKAKPELIWGSPGLLGPWVLRLLDSQPPLGVMKEPRSELGAHKVGDSV